MRGNVVCIENNFGEGIPILCDDLIGVQDNFTCVPYLCSNAVWYFEV